MEQSEETKVVVLTHYEMLYRNLGVLRARVKTMEQEHASLTTGLELFRDEIRRQEQVLEQARQRGEWDVPGLGEGDHASNRTTGESSG